MTNRRRNRRIKEKSERKMVGVVKKEEKEEEEDRINKLPDDVLRHILSYLDSRAAVTTSVLSKRWVNLWTTLPCLILKPRPFFLFGHSCHDFVTNFLKYRNQQALISTIIIDRKPEYINILDLAIHHNVEHLRIREVDFGKSPPINSAFMKTLHLTRCSSNINVMDWTLPNLTSLYLEDVLFGNQISGFENLKELNVNGYFGIYYDLEIFSITCPNLESLTLGPIFPDCTFIVSAPKLLYFEFRSAHVPVFSAGDGFPCIKEVDIDIEINDDDWCFYDDDRIKRTMQKLNAMLTAVRGTPLLKLSSQTIQFLRRIPDFSKYQPSPFGNLKILSLRGLAFHVLQLWQVVVHEKPTRSIDHVISYFLRDSPCAETVKGNVGGNQKLPIERRHW